MKTKYTNDLELLYQVRKNLHIELEQRYKELVERYRELEQKYKELEKHKGIKE